MYNLNFERPEREHPAKNVKIEPDMCEPDLAFSPKEIMENFVRGLKMEIQHEGNFSDDQFEGVTEDRLFDVRDFEDKFEAIDYLRSVKEKAAKRAAKRPAEPDPKDQPKRQPAASNPAKSDPPKQESPKQEPPKPD